MESCLYKIMSINNHSGFMLGPVTPVYGVGVIIILLVHKYIIEKLNINKSISIIITFFICMVLLSLIELLGGIFLDKILNIELWNYSSKKYNIGKYICLEVSIVWGLASIFFVYVVKPFMDRFIKKIPKKTTYLFITIFLLDLTYVIIKHL